MGNGSIGTGICRSKVHVALEISREKLSCKWLSADQRFCRAPFRRLSGKIAATWLWLTPNPAPARESVALIVRNDNRVHI